MANVAKRMAEVLRDLGVKYIFGVPSGNWIDFMEGIRLTKGIEFILVSHESSAGFMADVHWRLTGRLAACFGTFGPGACNLSTGVCGGYLDRSPLLAFADEMPDDKIDRIVQMNIDNQTLFKPITKWQTRLNPSAVSDTLHKAAAVSRSEVPGPVYIGIPAGIGPVAIKEKILTEYRIEPVLKPDAADIEKMRGLFQKAKKPLLVLGITSIRFGLRDIAARVAQKFEIPVVLTPMAKGMLPEDHPCYAGVLAHALSDRVALTYRQADLVVGIGYDPVEINYEDWMPSVPLIHIDTIPADVDPKKIDPVCDVTGDLRFALEQLEALKGRKKAWDLESLAKRRNRLFQTLAPSKDGFDIRTVLAGLREALPIDGIMTCDVGAHLHLIGQAWKTFSPECQLMTNGCSSMGFGIPAAISAKLSCPDRQVACVTGDGGFLMMAGEIATAVRLGTKIVFVLITDRNLSLIKIKQQRKNYEPFGTS
ncbi:MAG: thiamine pyrophosphate-binding protein, partial [Candidatus Aminicenantes bacterium]|nr:thiamine pyrophosphate-binding protein [Candidatus Aminicenantes bacterium]